MPVTSGHARRESFRGVPHDTQVPSEPEDPNALVSTPDGGRSTPTSAYPEVSRHGTGWDGLNHGRRHWRWHEDRVRSHHHRRWNRDSQVDTDTYPGVYSGDSQSRQGQNCDSLL